MRRIAALVAKDFAELRHSPGIFIPSLITGLVAILYPFIIAVIIPAFTGEQLSDSSDFEIAELFYRTEPGVRSLSPEAAIQAFIFQQTLALLVGLTTVTGGMSVAAHTAICRPSNDASGPTMNTSPRERAVSSASQTPGSATAAISST